MTELRQVRRAGTEVRRALQKGFAGVLRAAVARAWIFAPGRDGRTSVERAKTRPGRKRPFGRQTETGVRSRWRSTLCRFAGKPSAAYISGCLRWAVDTRTSGIRGKENADRAALHQRGTIAIRGHRFPSHHE